MLGTAFLAAARAAVRMDGAGSSKDEVQCMLGCVARMFMKMATLYSTYSSIAWPSL